MKKIEWKTLLKNRKVKKALIGTGIALVVIAIIVTAAVLLDAGTVKLINSDPEAGSVSGGGRISNGSSTTIHAYANDGYAFLNWTNPDGSIASEEADHTLIVPKATIKLTANWKVVDYPITLHLDSETNTTVYPATVNIKDEIIFLDPPTKENHTFLGWYKDSGFKEPAEDFIPTGTTSAVTLYARWAWSYHVTYDLVEAGASNNPDNPDTYTDFKDVELKNPVYYEIKDGAMTGGYYRFLGWKDKTTGETVDTLRANWKKNVELVASWDMSKPVYYTVYTKGSDTYVEYGRYPQHVLEDKRTISDLDKAIADGLKPDANGVYFFNNTLFVKLEAKPHQNDAKTYFAKFSDESDVKEKESYYFIVEPIVWKVLSGNPNDPASEVTLLAESVLTSCKFKEDTATRTFDGLPVYANNWEYSDIRTFLNGEFLDMAFMAGEEVFLQSHEVDYSAETVNPSNQFQKFANGDKCTDTVYLLSYADLDAQPDVDWTAKATDYAKAKGVYASINDGAEHDNAHWWLRSSGGFADFAAVANAPEGALGNDRVYLTLIGVRPVLNVKFGAAA